MHRFRCLEVGKNPNPLEASKSAVEVSQYESG